MQICTIDIETQGINSEDGEVCPWMGKIIGLGLCWGEDFEKDTVYYQEHEIEEIVAWLSEIQTPLVAYNALFEVIWLQYHYSQFPLNIVGDAALYSIALDNSSETFGLKDSAVRLVDYPHYEDEYQKYCVQQFGGAPSKWGSKIPRMPLELISKYCRHDVHATYLIWQKGRKQLEIEHISEFFMAEVKMTAEAYIIGTKINREYAQELYNKYTSEVEKMRQDFLTHPELIEHIEVAQKAKFDKELAKKLATSKTGKIREADFETWKQKHPFNPGSDSQLREVFKSQKLFWNPNKLIHEYPEFTAGGVASLSSEYIHLYGVGGKLLANMGETETKVNKLNNILKDSEYDQRAHFDINLCSVRSTRVSARGLNIVATPLDNDIGETFVADEGWKFYMTDFCLPLDTEYLTPDGWKTVRQLKKTDMVWQVRPHSLIGNFVTPKRIIMQEFVGKMYTYRSREYRCELRVTAAHKMLWAVPVEDEFVNYKLQSQDHRKVRPNSCFIHFSNSYINAVEKIKISGRHYSKIVELAIIMETLAVQIEQNVYELWFEGRGLATKCKRLTNILSILKIQHKVEFSGIGKHYARRRLIFRCDNTLMTNSKLNFHHFNRRTLHIILGVFAIWFDESKTKQNHIYSFRSEDFVDRAQAFFCTQGFEALKEPEICGRWRLTLIEKGYSPLTMNKGVSSEDYIGVVGCVSVPEGFIMIRQKGRTYVTGNCQLEPTVSSILTKDEQLRYCAYHGEGKVPFWNNGVLQIDDTYLCYLSATKRWGRILEKEFDPEEWMTNPEAVKKKFKIMRQAGKKLVLMTGYGSGIQKVCDSILKELEIEIPLSEGKELINTLWTVFPNMYRYICKLKSMAENGHKIYTWLGFPITGNSSTVHCIFNYRVQTEAAHIMKHLLWQIYQRKQDWFVPSVANIHDACAFLVHEDKIPQFELLLNESLNDLNESLAPFTDGIKLRLSSHVGKTLREAKEG